LLDCTIDRDVPLTRVEIGASCGRANYDKVDLVFVREDLGSCA
jgi:hypothetical protein